MAKIRLHTSVIELIPKYNIKVIEEIKQMLCKLSYNDKASNSIRGPFYLYDNILKKIEKWDFEAHFFLDKDNSHYPLVNIYAVNIHSTDSKYINYLSLDDFFKILYRGESPRTKYENA